MTRARHAPGAGVGKPPREETAGDGVERFRVRYGDLIAGDDVGDRWEDGHWSRWMRVISERLPVWAGEGSRTVLINGDPGQA